MSQLSSFFPSGPTDSLPPNATIVVVAGGAGNGVWCGGGGGGGIFCGQIRIEPGVSYPVIIGAGGAAGCCSPTCQGYPGGRGGNGGNSSFGKYKSYGGGAAGPFFACCQTCTFRLSPAQPGGNGGLIGSPYCAKVLQAKKGISHYQVTDTSVNGSIVQNFTPYCTKNFLGNTYLASQPAPCCYQYCSAFYNIEVASNPYLSCGITSCWVACRNVIACSRYSCGSGFSCPARECIASAANTGHAAIGYQVAGDSGVVVIVYPCPLGAATATPGANNCTPVTGPAGYRSYRFTASGSFTL